jgi:hypothetical protein
MSCTAFDGAPHGMVGRHDLWAMAWCTASIRRTPSPAAEANTDATAPASLRAIRQV